MSVSFAITAFNEQYRGEYDWIKECLRTPLYCDAISEVLVYDDGSKHTECLLAEMPVSDKLTVVLGRKNMGVYAAKIEAVAHSSGDWVITMDSDNHIERDVLDRLIAETKKSTPDDWLLPSYAMPKFNYRHLTGEWYMGNIHKACGMNQFDCFINTGNQTVYRTMFMDILGRDRGKILPQANSATDSTMLNDAWVRSGGKLRCLDWFEYHHRIGTGKASNYVRAPDDKTRLQREIIDRLRKDSLCQSES